PNQNETPDALDLALAKFEYLYGDKGAARTTVQAALAAGWYNPTVIYLAVREKLESPGRFMLFSNTSLGLRQYLVDAGGAVEAPAEPAAPATPPAEPVTPATVNLEGPQPFTVVVSPPIQPNPQGSDWAAPVGFTVVLLAGLIAAWVELRRR
ncbi:MAG: hypothetical protein ACM3XM_05475, partial [Mycobacterium leprae]